MRRSPLSSVLPALCVIILAATACTSTSHLTDASASYYLEGPDDALAKLDPEQVPPRDAVLVAMERAVVLQELGEFEKSNEILAQAARTLDGPDPHPGASASLILNDRAAAYRCEPFERVYLYTLAVSNHLALHDIEAAALAADQALEAIEQSGCSACRFPFTRYLAAIAFEHYGQRQHALEVLGTAVAQNPDITFLRSEMNRLNTTAMRSDARDLYIFLLLGRGPEKIENGVPVYPGHAIAWPHYVPRPPGTVALARVDANGNPLQSAVPLTNIEELAQTSLRSRMAGLVAKETGKTVAHEALLRYLGDDQGHGVEFLARSLLALADRADLRHWSTLPSSCQVVRVELPQDLDTVQLVYASETGATVHAEDLLLPADWRSGPLFVTRRVP